MSLDLTSRFLHFKVGMAKSCKHGGYAFGKFRLDPEKRMLYEGDAEISLPPKVVDTLIVLVESQGEIVSKAELIDKVWADSIVEESNLSQHLYLLRKTLGDTANGRPVIETLRRRGYRFNAETTLIKAETANVHQPRPSNNSYFVRREGNVLTVADWEHVPEAVVETPDRASSPSSWRNRFVLVFAAAAGVVVVLIGAYWFASNPQPGNARTAKSTFSRVNFTRVTTSGRTKRAAISPDGNHVAHVTGDSDGQSLWVRHIAAPTDVRIAGPAATEFVSVTFSPDGGAVYYVTLDRDKGEPMLYRVPVRGGQPRSSRRMSGRSVSRPTDRESLFSDLSVARKAIWSSLMPTVRISRRWPSVVSPITFVRSGMLLPGRLTERSSLLPFARTTSADPTRPLLGLDLRIGRNIGLRLRGGSMWASPGQFRMACW